MDEVVTYHCSIFENILIHNEAGAREAMMAHLSRVEELHAMESIQKKKKGKVRCRRCGTPLDTEIV